MITLLLHVQNAEPIKVDVEELPAPTDYMVVGKNPRERNDKELKWVEEGVTTVYFPIHKMNFIQVLPDDDEEFDFVLPYREE